MARQKKTDYRWSVFGGELKRVLKAAGLQHKQVAGALACSPALISNWVVGRDRPTPESLEKLAAFIEKEGAEKRIKIDRIGWLHLLFIGEYFDWLSQDENERDVLWKFVKAGATKLSDNRLLDGFHQVRALIAFSKDHQLLDGQGAVAWQESLIAPDKLQCFWVVTLDFRDNQEFFDVARRHIAAGAKYVYFIRDKHLATDEQKRNGEQKEFDRYFSRLIETGLDPEAVKELAVPVTFHDDEHILALDFVVSNPHSDHPTGFQSFIRIDPRTVYNVELSDAVLNDRIKKLRKYLKDRDPDIKWDNVLFPTERKEETHLALIRKRH